MDDLPKSLKIRPGQPQWVSRTRVPPFLKGMVLRRIPGGQQLVTLQEAT